jgi:hypothetical protein
MRFHATKEISVSLFALQISETDDDLSSAHGYEGQGRGANASFSRSIRMT